MIVNALTLDELTNRKLKTIANNVILGPQAEILNSLETINRTFNLNLGVTKTFRWSPGIYDQIKDKISEYNGFNMSNSGMYHLFRRVDENNQYYKRQLKSNVVRLEQSLQDLRAQGQRWQDNTDLIFDVYAELKERINTTYQNVNDDVEISYNILEQIDDDDNLIYNSYRIRFLITYNNIDVHLWTDRNNRYLGQIPTGKIKLNIQMDLIKALNLLATRYNNIFRLASIPSTFRSNVFGIRGIYDNNASLKHPFIGDSAGGWNGGFHKYCPETMQEDWKNVCTGDLSNEMNLECVNFDVESINKKFKQWLSNFIVNRTHPLNSFRTWFHGLPNWLENAEDLHNVIGHRENPNECQNAMIIDERDGDAPDHLAYCDSSECQLRDTCDTFLIYSDENYFNKRDALYCELAEVFIGSHIADIMHKFRGRTPQELQTALMIETKHDRMKLVDDMMKLYCKLHPNKIYGDIMAFYNDRALCMANGHNIIQLTEDYRLELENLATGTHQPEQGGIIDSVLNSMIPNVTTAMNDYNMIRTLQSRMGMIPTVSQRVQTDNEEVESLYNEYLRVTEEDNIHGGEEPDEVDNEMTDEEWEEYQRDMDENPEPNNQEEE